MRCLIWICTVCLCPIKRTLDLYGLILCLLGSPAPKPVKKHRKINCLLTKNMKENHEMWVAKIQEEEQQKALSEKLETIQQQVCLLFLTI